MADSSIEWTDATWNPTVGCSIASPGCTNCYAMRMAARLEAMGMEKYAGTTRKSGGRAKWTGIVRLDHGALYTPYGWKSPKRVFVNSMSDLFHENLSTEDIRLVWDVMKTTPEHEYQILTKRPERMALLSRDLPQLPNVWLGTSIESVDHTDRLDHLRQTRAAIRFVSFEPLIASVGSVDMSNIDWAIVGGESGPQARPMEKDWVDEILAACRNTGAAFFFKQWGGVQKKKTGRTLNGRTYDEFPLSSLA